MKNKETTNTQQASHTPAPLEYSRHYRVDAQGSIYLPDGKTGNNINLTGSASMEQKELDQFGELFARAPELLKENEQLKERLKLQRSDELELRRILNLFTNTQSNEEIFRINTWIENNKKQFNLSGFINAELLEALKSAEVFLAWSVPISESIKAEYGDLKEKIESAIAKAEGKDK